MKKLFLLVILLMVAVGVWFLVRHTAPPAYDVDFSVPPTVSEERGAELKDEIADLLTQEASIKNQAKLAYDYLLLGQLGKSRQIYEQYINDHAHDENYVYDPALLKNYAGILLKMNEGEKAAMVYKTILDTYQETTETDILNYVDALKVSNATDARIGEILERAAGQGQTVGIMSALAQWYEATGDCAQAVASLEVIAQLKPEFKEQNKSDIVQLKERCVQR